MNPEDLKCPKCEHGGMKSDDLAYRCPECGFGCVVGYLVGFWEGHETGFKDGQQLLKSLQIGLEESLKVSIKAFDHIAGHLLEAIKPWDAGHSACYDIANKTLGEIDKRVPEYVKKVLEDEN